MNTKTRIFFSSLNVRSNQAKLVVFLLDIFDTFSIHQSNKVEVMASDDKGLNRCSSGILSECMVEQLTSIMVSKNLPMGTKIV